MKIKRKAPAASTGNELSVRRPGGRDHYSWAIYGRSGTGKTTLAGSFPGPILLLDVKDVGDDSLTGTENLDVHDVPTWDDFEMTFWWVKKNPGKYNTIVIDTMSQLQQLAIRKVLEDKGKDADRAGEWGMMAQKDWGTVASLMKSWIINVRDLPMNVVFIAQDRTFNVSEEDAAEGLDPEIGPGLSPSIAKCLNAAVHVLANTFIRRRVITVKVKNPPKGKPPRKEIEKIEFCLRVGPNPVYATKVRKPKYIQLPSVVVDPTYEKLVAIIKGDDK